MYNKTLNKKFWKNKQFDNKIRLKILKIVNDYLESLENMEIPVYDVRLTGSLANFNYNKFSDLDVHIITKFKEINKDVKFVKEALNDKKFIWNLKHNICFRGHELELYFEDKGEIHVASGVYSLLREKWIKQPKYDPPENVDNYKLKQKTEYIKDLVNRMIKKLKTSKDKEEIKLIYNKTKLLKSKIMNVRREALQTKGEFAFENLLFKKLRNQGVIEKLLDLLNHSYDRFFMESLKFNKTLNKLV
jgi:predicted nucleotidyltransferase